MGEKYADRQTTAHLGEPEFPGQENPFPNAEGVKVFSGFGADDSDLRRGWVEPVIRQDPRYDLVNHKQKWTEFRISDEDSNGGEDLPNEFEFRMKDRETKGLFIRPHIPTER